MGTLNIEQRVALYAQMERLRKRPLIVYVTSSRGGATGQIAADVVPELLDQLQVLPEDTEAVDLLLVSNGGDPTVAWRVVSLIRERVSKFSVLLPQAAFSAATLIALGADEIIMHPHANLGPTDVQIMVNRKQADGQNAQVPFGSEDLAAFLKYAKETVGLTDQTLMRDVFLKFCDEVGTVAIGVAARSSQLGLLMGEKLLQLHMTGDNDKQKARAISEKLTRDYFHHGYPVSKSEASEIGLKVAARSAQVEALMWRIWVGISDQLQLRQPFNPMTHLARDPSCDEFMKPFDTAAGVAAVGASTRYENILAIVESSRLASQFIMGGIIAAVKAPPHNIQLQQVPDQQTWKTVWPGGAGVAVSPAKGTDKPKARATKKAVRLKKPSVAKS